MGEEHPLAIAARRALAVSRGQIAELSASRAPSASEALREVGEELSRRFEIDVAVHAEPLIVTPSDREDIVVSTKVKPSSSRTRNALTNR